MKLLRPGGNTHSNSREGKTDGGEKFTGGVDGTHDWLSAKVKSATVGPVEMSGVEITQQEGEVWWSKRMTSFVQPLSKYLHSYSVLGVEPCAGHPVVNPQWLQDGRGRMQETVDCSTSHAVWTTGGRWMSVWALDSWFGKAG